MLYKRSQFKPYEILKPLSESMYCSPKISNNLYLQIIEKLNTDQHISLLNNLHAMLLLIDNDIGGFIAYHSSELSEHECRDPLKTIRKDIALNVPDFGWNIITRCAYYHSCWFECLQYS